MDHTTLCSRQFSALPSLGVLLGALACGDGGTMSPATASSANRTSDGLSPPAASPAASDTVPGAAPAETPVTPDTASNGSAEGSAAGPITRDGEQPAEGAGATGQTTPDDPASDGTPAGAPGSNGDEPTLESATSPGPFPVLTVTAGLRDGPDYGSQTLHVPDGAEPPFASVAIVPGFNTPESSIQAWGPFLASHGIVTLTIGTNTPTDSAALRARAVLDALETLRAEDARSGSALEGKLSLDRLAIMGWSLGGGGVLTAASSTPSLKAAITMAAYGPGAQFPNDQVPTLFLAGSADPNAGGQSQGMFASLPDTTPKMLFEVRGGPHEIGNDPANADGEIGRYGLSWLEVFLVGDERYRQFLEQAPSQASDFQQNLTAAP